MADTFKTHPFQRFIQLLKPEKSLVFTIYIYAVFAGLISLSLPLGIQAIINLIMGGQVSTSWIILVVLVIFGIVANGYLQVRQLTVNEVLQQKIFSRASFEFAYRIPRLKIDQIKQQYLPELINRFFDTMSVQKGLSKILIDFSTAFFQIVFGLILISFYHPFFIIFSFFLIVLIFLIVRLTGPRGLKTSLVESKHKYKTAHWLEELARNVESFKMAGDSTLPLEKNDEHTNDYINARKNHFKVIINQFSLMIGFKAVVAAGLLLIGGILVIEQQMNIGQFVAAEIIVILIINSVEKIIFTIEAVYDVLTSVEKIAAVTDLPLEEYLSGNKPFTQQDGMGIKLKNVQYSDKDSGHIFLNDINLDIKSGEKIAIAGSANAGKAILLQFICGWYSDYEGNILYNNTSLQEMKLSDIRRQIGDCMTTGSIFQGTIEENISIGSPMSSFEELKKAAEITGLAEYLEATKEGYQMILYPGDKAFPKKVQQQILWTRGILGNKALVLWEDVFGTTSRDEKMKFVDHLLDRSNDKTILMVSNDMRILEKCDRVIGMENGVIVHDLPASEARDNEWFEKICLDRNA
ncbi:ABC-type bacteriocin/lantibiotic exporter, contains an N-terminal double-glycine peptidase domain [Marivirga sericea]|uniref:ABC-type bacteriocin/lantibiotic exporter, contains an N-terminal double-glycine peptidase domain n=1 Tax=Marivirga sericea TaxID=1028 RepID=A0A1X7LG33_9BACT|nr:ABC transporter transmembrane domain-containing protein [Marivirga sericea]SMG52313.1 ABC-type bacteriocin/lantibiotic exporter, contains an N-terminal double-glycine peptidase domain [Marivirga sericea]